MSASFDRLAALISRRMAAQERAGRIAPPRLPRARRRGPTREELAQAIALADAYLLAHGRLSPTARGALQGAQTRRAMRAPKGDFSTPAPYQPTADQLTLLDLSYVPSPPDPARYPWTLLSSSELEDVKRRLYAPGGPVAQRMAAG